jgi:hypothetical protein
MVGVLLSSLRTETNSVSETLCSLVVGTQDDTLSPQTRDSEGRECPLVLLGTRLEYWTLVG